MRYTDRSRVIEYQRCPRARWWAYEFGGQGIDSIKTADALETGRAVHEGLATLLQGGAYAPTGNNLVDGLVLGWKAVRLPAFLREYEVLSVEEEINFPLCEDITFMSRPDGVLRYRETGMIHTLSFKTAAYYNAQTEAQGYHDDQHLSEALAIYYAYREMPESTHMEYLLKGAKRRNDETGAWEHDSLFNRVWKRDGEYRIKYSSAKGWLRTDPVQEFGTMAAWIEWLLVHEPDALAACFIVPIEYPIERSEMREWQEAAVRQERRIAVDAYQLAATGFPMHRRACDWPGPCRFQGLCYNAAARENPLGNGYKVRQNNHPQEEEVA